MLFKKKIAIALLIFSLFACSEKPKEYNYSDLKAAVNKEDPKEIDEVLRFIEINTTDSVGNTILMYAVKNNKESITKHLLDLQADPNILNNDNLSPLAVARKNKNEEISNHIRDFQYYDWLKEENKFSEEAFEYAVDNDNTKIVSDFLKNGRGVEEECISKGLTPLIHALFTDSYGVIKVLLNNNANPNASFDTRPAIAISAMFNQYEVTKMLIEKGADVNVVDGPLTSPLMFAAEEGNLEIVELLMENGADTGLLDQHNETAKDKAIKNNHQDIAKMLVQ